MYMHMYLYTLKLLRTPEEMIRCPIHAVSME